jgi:hypothetical protein
MSSDHPVELDEMVSASYELRYPAQSVASRRTDDASRNRGEVSIFRIENGCLFELKELGPRGGHGLILSETDQFPGNLKPRPFPTRPFMGSGGASGFGSV